MTTLADIRTKARKDLHDTDAAAYRWTDAQLDRHIEHALADLDLYIPQEKTATLATTNGSRDLSLASLTGLLAVEAAEYPLGIYPPAYVRFSVWGATLTLLVDTAPTGDNAKFFYSAKHVLDGGGSTVPVALAEALAMGAAGYAAVELGNYTIDRLTTGGSSVDRDYASWGQAWLTAYRQLLQQQSTRNRVRAARLYVPA